MCARRLAPDRNAKFVVFSAKMLPSNLRTIRLSRRSEPFNSEEFLFELKIDGFRALAYIENGECRLVSRNGNVFHGFADLANWVGKNLRVTDAVLDGEIACIVRV